MDNFKQIKFQTALLGAKITSKLLKLFSKSAGTALPGVVAMRVDKQFLSDISQHCNKKIITITGTNGKTTTSGLIADILNASEQKVLHNQQGANMPQGIAASLAIGISPLRNVDYFVLETDEAYLTKIYSQMRADYLVITNLFQDQTDRHGGIDFIAKKIREAIDKNPELTVILNADDVRLRDLYTKKTLTYGFETIEIDKSMTIPQAQGEILYCVCGQLLDFSKNFYAHIGHYKCPCGYSRPTPDVCADAKIFPDKTVLKVKYKNNQYEFVTKLCGIYNAYNTLAAIAMAFEAGIESRVIQNALDNFNSEFGRSNKFQVNNKNLYLQMVKNPSGMTEGIKLAISDNNSKLLIMVNDEYSDGRDVSWLWDVDFTLLKDYSREIYVSGKRAYDVALRLKYLNYPISKININENIEETFNGALDSLDEKETLYIFPCYSAMVELEAVLKK